MKFITRIGVLVLALALSACSASISVDGAATAPWQDILVVDCSGGIRVFPSHPVFAMQLNATIVRQAWNLAATKFVQRTKCHCSDLTTDEVSKSFTPDFGALLAAIEGKSDTGLSARTKCGAGWSIDQLGQYFTSFTLPSTCSSALYDAGSACAVQIPVTGFDTTLQFAAQACPGTTARSGAFPSFQISCSGDACTDLLLPCTSTSDCIGSSCDTMSPATQQQIQDGIARALNSTGLFPFAEQNSCASTSATFSSTNVGTKIFSALMAILSDVTQTKSGVHNKNTFTTLKFCGINRFAPFHLYQWKQNWWPLSILTDRLPGFAPFGAVDHWVAMVIGWLPFGLDKFGTPTTVYNYYYGYYTNYGYSGFQQLASLVFYPFSFFTPLINTFKLQFTRVGMVVSAPDVAAWSGTLQDGTSVTDLARRTGTLYPPTASSLPTPSMGSGSHVNLFTHSCNNTINLLQGQPIGLGLTLPPLNRLYNATYELLQAIETCRISKTSSAQPLGLVQMLTRFNPISSEMWLNLFVAPVGNGFTASPAEAELQSLSSRISPKATTGLNQRLSLPSSCQWAQVSANGQCSMEYTYLNQLYPGKDLTIKANIERCWDYPSALPSVNIQCTGADCTNFLSTQSQVKYCSADADCGSGKTCQLIDTTPLDNYVLESVFPMATISNPSCDSGIKTAQETYNFVKQITNGDQITFPESATTFGLCSLDGQTLDVDGVDAWWQGAATATDSLITVAGLNAYSATWQNNSLWFGVTTPATPNVFGSQAVFTLIFKIDPANVPTGYKVSLATDIGTALGISAARITIGAIEATQGTTVQAEIEITIAPSATESDVTPEAALNSLKTQLADPDSTFFKQSTTSTVVAGSLTVEQDGSGTDIDCCPASTLSTSIFTTVVLAAVALFLNRQ